MSYNILSRNPHLEFFLLKKKPPDENVMDILKATFDNNVCAIPELLQRGFDVNSPYFRLKGSLLHVAAELGRLEIAELLLAHNAEIDQLNQLGDTPLKLAALHGCESLVTLFLKKGAKVDGVGDRVPLHGATFNGHPEATKLLLESGAKTEILTKKEETPLHLACQSGSFETVKIVLKYCACINPVNDQKETPLHNAVQHNRVEIVRFLLEMGADVNCVEVYNRTPLYFAVSGIKDPRIIEMLVDYHADIEWRDYHQDTPLHAACKISYIYNNVSISVLLRKGANINVVNNDNQTPFTLLISNPFNESVLPSILEIILDANIDINARDNHGKTALMVLVARGNQRATEVLLEHSANINIQDKLGDTALHRACDHNQRSIVNTLISYGASIDIKNRFNEVPQFTSGPPASLVEIKDKYDREMKEMKLHTMKIPSKVFYDIWSGRIHQMIKYARNPNVMQFFIEENYAMFPLHSRILSRKYAKIVNRYRLLNQSCDALYACSSSFYRLPYNCVEKIFNYLPNIYLKWFIDICTSAVDGIKNI